MMTDTWNAPETLATTSLPRGTRIVERVRFPSGAVGEWLSEVGAVQFVSPGIVVIGWKRA